MTEELFARDSYLVTCEATVTAATPDGVVLDRTVFYPRGGGQPGDTGFIRWEDGECRITDTVKADGEVLHHIDAASESPPVGTVVAAEIDWGRRHVLMRTHTALHALSGIVLAGYGAKVTGGNIDLGSARMDFELESITPDMGRDVENRLNSALAEDRPVRVTFLPRDEALADPALIRTKVSLIPEHVDPIRIVDIEGIDKQADGGTHVHSTGEVGYVKVVKTENKGKGFRRMRIELTV